MRKSAIIALSVVILFISAGATYFFTGSNGVEEDKKDKNHIKAGENVPEKEPAPGEKTGQEYGQFAVRINRTLTGEEKESLNKLCRYVMPVQENALLVKVEKSKTAEIKALSFVEDVSLYDGKNKMSAELAAQDGNSERVEVTVSLVAPGDKSDVCALVENLGGQVLQGKEKKGSYLRVEVPESSIDRLAASPGVLYVEETSVPELLNDRAKDITGLRPLSVSGFISETGLTGKGQTIGLADSGLSKGRMSDLHPDLKTEGGRKLRVIMLKSWAGVETPADETGHGTHMAATLAGSGKASNGKYAGMAPGASIYFQGIMDEEGDLFLPLDLHELFEPAYEAGVRVHVNGWGRKKNIYNSTSAQIDRFVYNHPEFLPVFGAGNSGPENKSITAEANSKNALVMGASVNPRPAFESEIGLSTDIAGFSSRGPAGDGRIKPDLVAPGKNIISAASGLIEDHLPGRPEYNMMSGTSMAASVAGGAAAVVREFFEDEAGWEEPSSALLKAALVNGAQRLDEPMEKAGFGLIDPAGTVLALQNDLFQIEDDKKGLAEDEEITKEIEIEHSGAPFKATLAWADPAGVPGAGRALANDLDLEVTTPGGDTLYGNDFENQGRRDNKNNVEQVYIEEPEKGTYEVTVRGEDINVGKMQSYALVCGQMPLRGTVFKGGKSEVTLAGGKMVKLPEDATLAVDGSLKASGSEIPPGTRLYAAGDPGEPEKVYAAACVREASGVKTLVAGDTTIFARMNREYREGGYAVDPQAGNVLEINGHTAGQEHVIPLGSTVTGYIDPRSQTLWKVSASGEEVEGVLSGIDREEGTIKLLDKDKEYTIAEEASISFDSIIKDSDAANIPFGASIEATREELLSGMPVSIILGTDGKIYHLAVDRHMVMGEVTEINPAERTIILSSGGRYHVMEGINITRNGREASLEDVKEGETAFINLIPDSTQALGVTLYSQVNYGKVIYAGDDRIYLAGNKKGFQDVKMSPEVQVFRWGIGVSTSILNSGQWVRTAVDPVTGEVMRVDIAEDALKSRSVIKEFIREENKIITGEGDEYQLSSACKVTKNGLPVKSRDLKEGETVSVESIYGPDGDMYAALVESTAKEGAGTPEFTIRSRVPFQDYTMVTGKTSADRLYACPSTGECVDVDITDRGEFYYPVSVEESKEVQFVAVDDDTGGVAGLELSFARRQQGFVDTEDHWAQIDINHLAGRGLISGYPDGTFRPEQPVNRVEYIVMLSRLIGGSGYTGELTFKDSEKIPDWAAEPVRMAQNRGLAGGYEDNTFRPFERVTREEAVVFLLRAYDMMEDTHGLGEKVSSFEDRGEISGWAREPVEKARALGLVGGREGNKFCPKENITRAEAAALLNRLLMTLNMDTAKMEDIKSG